MPLLKDRTPVMCESFSQEKFAAELILAIGREITSSLTSFFKRPRRSNDIVSSLSKGEINWLSGMILVSYLLLTFDQNRDGGWGRSIENFADKYIPGKYSTTRKPDKRKGLPQAPKDSPTFSLRAIEGLLSVFPEYHSTHSAEKAIGYIHSLFRNKKFIRETSPKGVSAIKRRIYNYRHLATAPHCLLLLTDRIEPYFKETVGRLTSHKEVWLNIYEEAEDVQKSAICVELSDIVCFLYDIQEVLSSPDQKKWVRNIVSETTAKIVSWQDENGRWGECNEAGLLRTLRVLRSLTKVDSSNPVIMETMDRIVTFLEMNDLSLLPSDFGSNDEDIGNTASMILLLEDHCKHTDGGDRRQTYKDWAKKLIKKCISSVKESNFGALISERNLITVALAEICCLNRIFGFDYSAKLESIEKEKLQYFKGKEVSPQSLIRHIQYR